PASALLIDLYPAEAEADRTSVPVHLDIDRRQAFGEPDSFLQRLGHLLVVQRVARRVDQPAAIGDGRTAPALQKLTQVRPAPFRWGLSALFAYCPGMGDEFVGDLLLPR